MTALRQWQSRINAEIAGTAPRLVTHYYPAAEPAWRWMAYYAGVDDAEEDPIGFGATCGEAIEELNRKREESRR